MRKYIFLFLLFAFGTFLLAIPVNAFYDTFQNHPNDNVSKPSEEYNAVWYYKGEHGGGEVEGDVSVLLKDINNKEVRIQFNNVDPVHRCWMWLSSPSACSNHWSFLLHGYVSADHNDGKFEVRFYDEEKNLIATTDNLVNILYQYQDTNLWEFVRSGSDIYLYINGSSIGKVATVSDGELCYIEFWIDRFYDNSEEIKLYVDDVSNGYEAIETFPHNWYILRHWDTPETSGLYDESDTRVEEHSFTVSYIVPYIATDACDEIRIKHFTNGEVVNTTPISDRYGTIYYNFTEILFHQNKEEDRYGYYLVELMRNGSVVARDYFYFTWDALDKPAGTISWDKDSYASGSIAKVHVNLTDPDFSTYVYKGYVYDAYGNVKEEWTVTSADEWYEVDLNGYDAGVYYAILKIRNKNTGFEWEEAWDVASVSEEVRIEGVSYDAKSESVLGGVYVNAIQNYEDHELTTDATTGEYNISGLRVDMEIQMNASKTNHTHNNFSFTPLQNGLYEINLFLLPDVSHINVTAPAIVGLTQSYPFHQNVSYATVNIWNDTSWSANTTTNNMGYFAFENLSPG
ncbi:MAG: hypothetical protein DRP08_05020, partial [Candidatus Aenigmatarchaeota archaeon]